jgi:hypothetical protein
MAFTSTLQGRTVIGSKWVAYGTWDGTAVTTGELDTTLDYIEVLVLTHTGNGVKTNAPSIDETIPGDIGKAVTLDFDSGTAGTWFAIGRV